MQRGAQMFSFQKAFTDGTDTTRLKMYLQNMGDDEASLVRTAKELI